MAVSAVTFVSDAAGFRAAFPLCASVSLLGSAVVLALGRAGRFAEARGGTTR